MVGDYRPRKYGKCRIDGLISGTTFDPVPALPVYGFLLLPHTPINYPNQPPTARVDRFIYPNFTIDDAGHTTRTTPSMPGSTGADCRVIGSSRNSGK
jgi:hypothetical protein